MSGLDPVPVDSLVPPQLPTSPPPLCIEHRVRVSALEPERIWKLRGDTLWMGTEGQADIPIPLASIRELRLAYEPSRMQLNRYRCYLSNATGKCATIQNEHFAGFASFEDRSPSYISFIEALIHRVSSISPGCVFKTGTSALSWWGHCIFTLFVFTFLLLVLIALYTAIGPLVIIKLVIIAFFIPALIRWFMKNKPRTFDPSEIPKALLPK